MYNQNYDQYFNNSLNYPQDMYNTYTADNNYYPGYCNQMNYMMNGYNRNYSYTRNSQAQAMNQSNENLYPEIYKIVYPMIVKICSNNTRAINEDLIKDMTDTIYNNIESEDYFENDTREAEVKKGDVRNPNAKPTVTEVKEDRQKRQNTSLRDLIRILILRELLGNPSRPPIRPRPRYGEMNFPMMMPREMYQDMYY